MLSSFLIFIFIWINIDALFMLLPNGDKYEAGKSVVLILGIAKCINSTLFVSSSALNYSKYYYWSFVFTVMLTVMAVVLNVLLIPRWGMDGASLSHLISYFTFYVSLLVVVMLKLKINIFSKAQLKVLVLIAGLLLLNYGWVKWVYPLFMHLPFSVRANTLIDAGLKSCILSAVTLVACYYWHVSEDVNNLIRKTLHIKR